MFMSSAANTIPRPAPPIAAVQLHVVQPHAAQPRAVAAPSGQTSVAVPHYIRTVKTSSPVPESGRSGPVVQADNSGKTEGDRGESDRGGKIATGNQPSASTSKASTGSVLNSAFNYDSETRHVVMQMRDGSGAVVVQIPSEQALRQYEQAQKQVKDGAGAGSEASSAGTGAEAASSAHAGAAASAGGFAAGNTARYNVFV